MELFNKRGAIVSLSLALLLIIIFLQGCKGEDCQTPTSYTVEEDGTILLDKELEKYSK